MEWLKALLEALSSTLFKRPGSQERDFRIRTSLPAEITDEKNERFDARVSNLSRRGLKVVMAMPLHRDQEMLVEIQGQKRTDAAIRIRARVVWSKKRGKLYDVGLEFRSFHNTQFDDVVQFFRDEVKLDVDETARRLRSPRRVLRASPLRYSPFGNLRVVKGIVQNISHTGLRFLSEEPEEAGTVLHLTVELPEDKKTTLTVIATVRRCVQVRPGQWDVGATMHPADEYNHEVLESILTRYTAEPNKPTPVRA